MEMEKFFNLLFNNPTNISVQYSNINGKEKLIVNGKDVTKEEPFDDSEIKDLIKEYKKNLKCVDDCIWEEVLDRAEEENLDLCEMNKGLELESYTEEDAIKAANTITVISELINEVIDRRIQYLNGLKSKF